MTCLHIPQGVELYSCFSGTESNTTTHFILDLYVSFRNMVPIATPSACISAEIVDSKQAPSYILPLSDSTNAYIVSNSPFAWRCLLYLTIASFACSTNFCSSFVNCIVITLFGFHINMLALPANFGAVNAPAPNIRLDDSAAGRGWEL